MNTFTFYHRFFAQHTIQKYLCYKGIPHNKILLGPSAHLKEAQGRTFLGFIIICNYFSFYELVIE
jgi:hypothetical protein